MVVGFVSKMTSQTRIFVGNLPDKTSEKDLHAAFSAYGEIINLDLKTTPAGDDKRNFAFITLSCSNQNLQTCIDYFGKHNFKGQKLYVTRARESFLERLQRERQQEQKNKEAIKEENLPKKNPIINLGNKLNPNKRKVEFEDIEETSTKPLKAKGLKKVENFKAKIEIPPNEGTHKDNIHINYKKEDADKKRLESIKKKRQEFKKKQTIIKTGLLNIDKVHNKKIIFSDEDTSPSKAYNQETVVSHLKVHKKVKNNIKKKALLDDDDSEDEITFEIKKQFEGKNGQKVLDLQSRYKSDKRFVLDERFIDNEEQDENADQSIEDDEREGVELGPIDEKFKQLNILQDVLGVTIKRHTQDPAHNKKNKSTQGMLRFDPTQPEHAKYLAPVDDSQVTLKKSKKKKKEKREEITKPDLQPELPKPEVSKEQFYKISETLKETIAKPTSFSLRSLFGNNEEKSQEEDAQQDTSFIPLQKPQDQKKKVKNPVEPGEKNPFVYDSSDSEDEQTEKIEQDPDPVPETEVKAVWKENLFFSLSDYRLKEGLAFFNTTSTPEVHKERRQLKSLMKKRIYNKERKNQMFQKKIGGRKKTMKKSFRKKP